MKIKPALIMKSILLVFILLPFIAGAQELSIAVATKHPMGVAFPAEQLIVTVQVKQNGKDVKILPDEIMVNGITNGNAEFGAITRSAQGIFKYTAPDVMPSKPIIAIAASIKNAKGEKSIATKNVIVIARKWKYKTVETTIYTCGTINHGVAYSLRQQDECQFELGDDLFVKEPAVKPVRIPQQIENMTDCDPSIATYKISPGKGELVTITSGKLNIAGGYVSFMLNGKIETSNIGSEVTIGGKIRNEDSYPPDKEIGTAPISFPTTPLSLMTAHGFAPGSGIDFWDEYTDNTANDVRTRHWLYLMPLK